MQERRTILVVDDAHSCAAALEISLSRIPEVDVCIVTSAEAARTLIGKGLKISAVITDLHLPNESGFDFIRWLRAQKVLASIPILVLSGDIDPDAPKKSLSSGADRFFAKPFSPILLRRTIEELIDAV